MEYAYEDNKYLNKGNQFLIFIIVMYVIKAWKT